ncbi:MAG: anti-sigma factor [Candidatus Omnitrophota bacterium]|jgi:hypothetical protein
MQDKLERLIKKIYRMWKSDYSSIDEGHPDEESMACFLEGRLSPEENNRIKAHLLACDGCVEVFAAAVRLKETPEAEVPAELLARVKNLLIQKEQAPLLEIFLRFKENILELVNTTGDVLVGQELVPAPVLRSRKIKDFKDEVIILKDFEGLRVEAKIENKGSGFFDLTVIAREKATSRLIKDLRITLTKGDLELESYQADTGKVTFEHVAFGKYTVELSAVESKLAAILLDIKV